MNDLDAELLYDRGVIQTSDFQKIKENLGDKSFKGINCSLLGFGPSGVIENEFDEDAQLKEDLYSTYGRCK